MKRYFSTFIGGTYPIIKKALASYLPDARIEFHSDDLVLFTTATDHKKVGAIPFFNNSFSHIKQFSSSNMTAIESQLNWAIDRNTFIEELIKFFGDERLKFRLVFSKNNQTIKVDSKLSMLLENRIISSTNLRLHKTLPDFEIWFMEKREGYGICGIRISKHADYQEVLEKGELRGELAYLMNFLSEPNENDIYHDPFCGNGSLPISRAKCFRYKQIVAADIDLTRINKKIINFKNFEIKQIDFINNFDKLGQKFNKIVTDPPWGISTELMNADSFYYNIVNNLSESLVPKGLAVILTAQTEIFEKLTLQKFEIEERYKIYVGGKEAMLFKARKI